MRAGFGIVATIVGFAGGLAGCRAVADRIQAFQEPPPPVAPVTYSQFHQPGFSWEDVARVVVVPVHNRSEFTRAGDEFRAALTSELQRLGRFEVVRLPPDGATGASERIHAGGAFDEAALLAFAAETRADVVVYATITQYSPYPRPRIGVVVQAVGPADAKVLASVDGLWDTTDAGIAEQVRQYYRQRPRPRPPWVRNHMIATDDAFAGELALESPALFMRYVGRVVAETLTAADVNQAGMAGTTGPAPCPTPSAPR